MDISEWLAELEQDQLCHVLDSIENGDFTDMTQVAIYTGQEANDQERLKLSGAYNPKEHLVTIQTKQGQKPYYPAAWRLYELSLKYADANFKSEIAFMDVDKDIVIVKAYLYLGPDYDTSTKKAEAFKQGKLSMLDKIETAAKARAARDFGISTELALDMEDATVDENAEVVSTIARSTVTEEHSNGSKQLTDVEQIRARALGLYDSAVRKGQIEEDKTGATFLKLASDVCAAKIGSIGHLTISRLDAIEKYLEAVK
jgi:hypothetical protein